MAFTVARGLQAISLVTIIGMTANFISEMVQASTPPPQVLIGTLSVVRLSLLSSFSLGTTADNGTWAKKTRPASPSSTSS